MGKDIIVHAGEELVYTHGSTFQLRPCACGITLAWQRGVYPFFNESLKSIAPRLERMFDTSVVVDDARLLDKTYTGKIYRSNSLKANLENLDAVMKFNYEFCGDTLHIFAK